MARFYVGQRVRIVRVHSAFEALGREATVIGVTDDANDYYSGEAFDAYEVNIDELGTRGPDGVRYGFDASCLEPILPSGHQPAELTVEELLPFLNTREVVV